MKPNSAPRMHVVRRPLCQEKGKQFKILPLPDDLVASALPAIDARAPMARAHVALKMKKWQRERERCARVAADNRGLLQRLAALMRASRLDNRWRKPLPNFQHKVGQFFDERTLRDKVAARRASETSDLPYSNVKCYACDYKKMQHYKLRTPAAQDSLPSIH